jgi:hypothetical protein
VTRMMKEPPSPTWGQRKVPMSAAPSASSNQRQ